jgi:hypothetical protein
MAREADNAHLKEVQMALAYEGHSTFARFPLSHADGTSFNFLFYTANAQFYKIWNVKIFWNAANIILVNDFKIKQACHQVKLFYFNAFSKSQVNATCRRKSAPRWVATSGLLPGIRHEICFSSIMAECRESPEYSSPPKRLKLDITTDGEPKYISIWSPKSGLYFYGL